MHIKLTVFNLVALFAGIFFVVAYVAAATEPGLIDPKVMPEVIYFNHGGYDSPIFVAASRMVLDDGFPNPEFPRYAKFISRLYQSPLAKKSKCLNPSSSAETESGLASRSDIVSKFHESDMALVGDVTGTQPGFLHHDIAGNLLRIVPVETLKGHVPENEVYVFFPVGNFQLGRVVICKTQSDYPEIPGLNDQVILMYKDNWYNESGILHIGGSAGVITLKKDGGVSLPRKFRDDRFLQDKFGKGNVNGSDVLNIMRSLVKGGS